MYVIKKILDDCFFKENSCGVTMDLLKYWIIIKLINIILQ